MRKTKGSIKQNKNGWYFIVDDGKFPDGKRKQVRRRGFNTYEEAESALNYFIENKKDYNKIKTELINWTDVGHAGELIVSTDLILNNFVPFTSQLPTSPVDLIAMKNNKTYRIQVKTSEFTPEGYLILSNLSKYGKDELDVLAAVDLKTKHISYIKWSLLNSKSKVRLYKNKKDNQLCFYDYLKFPES